MVTIKLSEPEMKQILQDYLDQCSFPHGFIPKVKTFEVEGYAENREVTIMVEPAGAVAAP